MKLKEKLKRFASMLLSITMTLTCLPMEAMAEETGTPSDLTGTEVMVIPVEAETTSTADLEMVEAEHEVTSESEASFSAVPAAEPEPASDAAAAEVAEEPDSSGAVVAPEPVHEETQASHADESEQEEPEETRHPLQIALDEHGCVYIPTARQAEIYADAELKTDLVYTTTQDVFLLFATGYTAYDTVEVWFLDESFQVVTGFADADDLDEQYLLVEEAVDINYFPASEASTSAGWVNLFVANGRCPSDTFSSVSDMETDDASPVDDDVASESELSHEQPADEEDSADAPSSEENLMEEGPNDLVSGNEGTIEDTEFPSDEQSGSEDAEVADASESPDESGYVELPVIPSETGETDKVPELAEEELAVIAYASPNDYIGVTTDTRVLSEPDAGAGEDYYCDMYLGNFVEQATVQVLSVGLDDEGNAWYQVRFLYGDTFPNGRVKWTDYAIAWVLASETCESFSDSCTVTDFAYPLEFFQEMQAMSISLFTTSMNGFTLKSINGSVGSFYAWQSGLYGSSGKDSAYPQIAKSASHGTIYATPHYLEGYTVYCLEHTLSGPGEGSGSNQTAKGPYVLVDMDYFVNDSGGGGVSGVQFSAKTMHALAWVLRHTYPFMALNRSDSNNEVWSRVAGQFAMREVIKQLEGSQYVRSYWDMDNFYAFSGGAPAVYLTYARWLAENGIARASITGKITASNQSISVSGSNYTGTVTLITDADLIRIPRSAGTLTGNSGGSDSSYYYIKSGDTIRVTSSSNRFTVPMESISSDDEEAYFLVGIPSVEIQKIMVPLYGSPYALQSASVTFELSYGDVTVTKKSSDGILLKDAVFELVNNSGNVIATAATNAQGIAAFVGIAPGSYQVREKTAPQGYHLSAPTSQNITVTAGADTAVTFTNERIRGLIRIVKTDSVTGKPLPGVVFSVTRLSGPASDNASDIGKVVATITTNADGIAQTGELPWGQYRITETGVLNGYLDAGFETTVTIE